jgi:dTDP-4-amino-4,6-dideoxygalactose transaminase
MTNIQAAILYGQLCDIKEIQDRKNFIFDEYKKNLELVDEISFQKIDSNTEHSKWMFGCRFLNMDKIQKKLFELYLFESGIDVRPMFYDIKKHTHLKNIKSNTCNAETLQNQCLILPSFPELTKSQIKFITNKIKNFLKNK